MVPSHTMWIQCVRMEWLCACMYFFWHFNYMLMLNFTKWFSTFVTLFRLCVYSMIGTTKKTFKLFHHKSTFSLSINRMDYLICNCRHGNRWFWNCEQIDNVETSLTISHNFVTSPVHTKHETKLIWFAVREKSETQKLFVCIAQRLSNDCNSSMRLQNVGEEKWQTTQRTRCIHESL